MLLKETNAALKREIWITAKYTFWRGFGVLSPPNRTSPFTQFLRPLRMSSLVTPMALLPALVSQK